MPCYESGLPKSCDCEIFNKRKRCYKENSRMKERKEVNLVQGQKYDLPYHMYWSNTVYPMHHQISKTWEVIYTLGYIHSVFSCNCAYCDDSIINNQTTMISPELYSDPITHPYPAQTNPLTLICNELYLDLNISTAPSLTTLSPLS